MLLLLFNQAAEQPPVADTHDGGAYYPTRRELEHLRKRLKEAEASREKGFDIQREQERRLELALQRAFRKAAGEPEPGIAGLIASVAPDAVFEPVAPAEADAAPPRFDFSMLAADLSAVTRLLAEIERRMQDDEDAIAILILAAA